MKNTELNIKESEFVKSSYKDHNIKIKHLKATKQMKIEVPFDDINKEKLILSEDKKYYLLYINPTVTHPYYPDIKFEIDLKFVIERETYDKEKLSLEEIVKRAFIEGDMFRSHYNPNADGRMWNVYYGGSF